ncbi:MAG: EAL domain-containing protein [Campylobacterota bacterium]|nr:EAL domain-containing protein [Campylobacterota bacterium]
MNNIVCERIIEDNCYISKTDLNGVITYANNNFCKISAFDEDELLGQTHSILKSIDTTNDTYKEMWDTILLGKVWKGVLKNSNKFGREFFMDTSIYPVINNDGNIQEFISFGNDLTHYLDIITYDQLTGLKNRDSLKHDINNIKSYICVIVNLDNFSDISEFYGGIIGDKVLIETANRLVSIFKGTTVYRLQADQFAILKILPQKYNKEQLEDIMKNKLRSTFESSYFIDELEIHITATSGISVGEIDNLRNANLAFKDAKSKNISFSIYEESMLEHFANYSKNKKIAVDIKKAIKLDQIIPYYQPIIDNNTKKVAKFEALARLIKDDDIVPPGAFIDISKKIKYYNKITRAILIKSFENFGNNKELGISINITIEDIANVRTFNLIIELLSRNSHNENITFELVESDGIEDYDLFDKFLQTIKSYGAKISIDDFGTGYSNFSYLAKIEPDFLKIDGSLIKNIKNKKDYDVVKTIVDFAKMYNIKTVAEFVENEEIFNLVKKLGVDYSQGYYFSKPLPLEDTKNIIINKTST